ncbi:hypothetical protein DEO72_LG3g1781 [Vigna unguiculata]|uniref:Uncharacterized protein n=1 Tax=Vigna unguiculata TaxID=3917 RepID=A0A4D6LFB3_VIGUN|nr:hypothetical protein DEO72_LG3g1781 [Vigna unguiculata]
MVSCLLLRFHSPHLYAPLYICPHLHNTSPLHASPPLPRLYISAPPYLYHTSMPLPCASPLYRVHRLSTSCLLVLKSLRCMRRLG